MVRRPAVLALVAFLGASGLAGSAAAQAVNGDVRCILMAGLLSQNTDPKAKPLASLMTFYYLGRADARGTPATAPVLAAQAKLVTPAEVNAIGQKCLADFQARGQALETAMRTNAAAVKGSAAPAPPPAPK